MKVKTSVALMEGDSENFPVSQLLISKHCILQSIYSSESNEALLGCLPADGGTCSFLLPSFKLPVVLLPAGLFTEAGGLLGPGKAASS